MTAENPVNLSVPGPRLGKVHDWGEMSSILDSHLRPENKKYLRVYFRTQCLLAENKKIKAQKLFGRLSKFTEFDKFEEDPANQRILSLIDLAVRGETRRRVFDQNR